MKKQHSDTRVVSKAAGWVVAREVDDIVDMGRDHRVWK
jgi:hypothetical protein